MKNQIPLKIAFKWIFLTSLFTCTLASGFIFLTKFMKHKRALDERFAIKAIIQTGPEKEALSTTYLAHLLQLNGKEKVNLYAFNEKRGVKTLKASPLIKEAKIKKFPPDTLYVDYTARIPIAILYDYTNTAIDREGYIFPLSPFFTPKSLPEIYLGLMPYGMEEDEFGRCGAKWQEPIQSKEAKLALEIVSKLNNPKYKEAFKLLRVDVSRAYSSSYGQKQVVLVVEDCKYCALENQEITITFPRLLKMSSESFDDEMERYLTLRENLNEVPVITNACHVKEKGAIIELRLTDMAFVKVAS